jgi:hypothetical protein
MLRDLRKASIYSDAILAILRSPAESVNGQLLLDEDFLRDLVPGANPRRAMPAHFPDLSVAEQDDEGRRVDSTKLRGSKI